MKRISITALAVTALAMLATSCSNDAIGSDNTPSTGDKQPMTFGASQESTRAAISGTSINWQSSDLVTIWDGTAMNEFSVTPGDPATSATLTGTVTKDSKSFIAVYPNSVGKNCTYTSDAINDLVIPATQTATAGTFDPAAGIMTASSTTSKLPFKNVCSFLKITTAAAYTKIVVAVKTGNLAGTFSVADFATNPTLTATTGVQTVTLSGTTVANGVYYIAVAPGTINSLKVNCYTDAKNYVEKSMTGDKTLTRSKVYNLGSTESWTAPVVTHEYVDLGLPSGTLWATCNVGATSPEEYGDYFMWGSTTANTSTACSWSTAPFNNGNRSYNKDYFSNTGRAEATGSATGTTLVSTYDAATANWGSDWRMPTETEMQELIDNTESEWTTVYGVYGRVFTNQYDENKSIFLPAAGQRVGSSDFNVGSLGYYWSSTLRGDDLQYGRCFNLGDYLCGMYDKERYYGQSVRPVRKK